MPAETFGHQVQELPVLHVDCFYILLNMFESAKWSGMNALNHGYILRTTLSRVAKDAGLVV